MITDFSEYREGETEDRAYWLTAAIESTYEKASGWNTESMIDDTVWALMLGFDMKLYDVQGTLVIDTDTALNALSPLVKKRVMSVIAFREEDAKGNFSPYVLFLGGREIGRLELRSLRPKKEMTFIQRSNELLIISIFALGGFTLILSIIFSRMLTKPVRDLTSAVTSITEGRFQSRVPRAGKDEISRLSDAFNRMAETLEVQESLRKKMTSDIAHELRTPVSAVRAELEAMMDGYIPIDRAHLQSLHDEIGRFRNIIEGIEDLSQAEASILHLKMARFELRPFLENISRRFTALFREKGISFTVDCDSDVMLTADPDKFSQIIINLLSNALKATERGGIIAITVSCFDSDVLIAVSDNGKGIDAKDLPFIFERFYKTAAGGLGLGLTIAKELVEAHKGTISAISKPGEQTIFTVTLPQNYLHNSS
ncbi:MAG: HAMP domain-containing histidine kinase [Nitrospiraceae bacterium]|nr:MAG: HAMP domain-containing histidine kinase [Nitrospiraceae bacterium]